MNLPILLRNCDLILLLASVLQVMLWPSWENAFAIICLYFGWTIIRFGRLTEHNFVFFPASSLMLLGLALFYYFSPTILMLLEGRKVIYNLRLPVDTLVHHAIFALVVVVSHIAYVTVAGNQNVVRRFLGWAGLFRFPSRNEIWFSALLGLFSAVYTYFIFGAWQADVSDRGVGYIVASVFMQFIWMPYLLLFPGLTGIETQNRRLDIISLAAFTVAVILVAIASNWRTILYSGMIYFFLFALISWLYGQYRLAEKLSKPGAVIALVCAVGMAGPLADFGYAMVEVRGSRVDLSATELVAETLRVFSERGAIVDAKKETMLGDDSILLASYRWNEEYLSNAVANRFVNLKISDNSIFYANQIGYSNEQMQKELVNQLMAQLPGVLQTFFVSSGERLRIEYSIGDYLYGLAVNDSTVLGSAVISSMPGVGLSIFGYWYIAVVILLLVPIFYLFDAGTIPTGRVPIFSYYYLVSIISVANYFNDRHVFIQEFRFLSRTFWEGIFMFAVAMILVRFGAKSFKSVFGH